MRSLCVIACSGVLLTLVAQAPLHAQANAPTKSEEVSNMQTETERLTAEKALIQAETDKIKAETDQWKAKYTLDFGTVGKSGAVDASGYKSLPWNKLVLGFAEDVTAILKLVDIDKMDVVLLSEKPIPELVGKRRFFDLLEKDVMDEIKKEPAEHQKIAGAAVASVAVASLDSLIKLFKTEKTVTTTEFTGLDEAFLHVVMGALLKKPGGANRTVYVNGFILPVPSDVELNAFNKKIKELTDRRRVLSNNLAHKEGVPAETIQLWTEQVTLVNDFIALFSLATQKGIEDLIVGEKLSKMPTLCLKVVKASGDTLMLKKTFCDDQLYVSRSFTVQYAQIDESGRLTHAGLYTSQDGGTFVRSYLKTSVKPTH